MSMKNVFMIIFLLGVTLVSYSQKGKSYDDYKSEYNAQVECLGTGTKGVFVFKVFTIQKGRNPDFEKSKRAAIFSVLFNGIPGVPSNGCLTQPPILSADDYEKHQDYFNDFFESGKFSQFISLADQSNTDVFKMKKGYQIGLSVTVRRDDLAKKMEQDGIRKGLSNYF
jgi:hypothetical protein